MGRKARLRKEFDLEKRFEEKAAIAVRQKAKRAPMVKFAIRFVAVLLFTIGLLYAGSLINSRIVAQANQEQKK